MSLAMELCMPLGRFLIMGWILEAMSVEGSFMGVGVNLRPRLRSSSSSLVICSLDMLTTVVFFFEWGIDGKICLCVRSMYCRNVS